MHPSMCKSEVQSLIPLVLCGHNILLVLLLSHSIPPLLPGAVLQDVKYLCEDEPQDGDDVDDDQARVAAVVERFILCKVYICGDNVA